MSLVLNDRESKMIRRLEADELRWRWIRWIVLFGAFITIIPSAYYLIHFGISIEHGTSVVAFLIPTFLLFMSFGCAGLGYAIARWNGDIRTQLIIKLLREKNHNNL